MFFFCLFRLLRLEESDSGSWSKGLFWLFCPPFQEAKVSFPPWQGASDGGPTATFTSPRFHAPDFLAACATRTRAPRSSIKRTNPPRLTDRMPDEQWKNTSATDVASFPTEWLYVEWKKKFWRDCDFHPKTINRLIIRYSWLEYRNYCSPHNKRVNMNYY